MNYQALLFKKVAGGWVYRAANPLLFGPATFYLLDDAQKDRVSAILLSADPIRRGLRLGFYVSLATVAWVFVAAGLMWALGLDADKATPAEFTAFVAIIVLPMIATLPIVALIQRRRLRPILDSAAPTDERITLADVQEAQKTAAPLYSRNAVSPGFIETDMTQGLPKEKVLPMIPLGRFGESWEVAEAVSFLASEKAAYITGQIIAVNGGAYM